MDCFSKIIRHEGLVFVTRADVQSKSPTTFVGSDAYIEALPFLS
jgi:hypothetical protein